MNPSVHTFIMITKRTTVIYENKKSGILTHNEMDSALVGLSVPVSNFFKQKIILDI
jgi:hypothetical protein